MFSIHEIHLFGNFVSPARVLGGCETNELCAELTRSGLQKVQFLIPEGNPGHE